MIEGIAHPIGRQLLFIKRTIGPLSGHLQRSLEELQPHAAVDPFLCLGHEGPDSLGHGGEPLSEIGIAGERPLQRVLEIEHLPGQGQRFQGLVGGDQAESGGRLVHLPRFDSHQPAFDVVDPSVSVRSGPPVQFVNQIEKVH